MHSELNLGAQFFMKQNRNEAKGVGSGGEALRKKFLFTLRKFLKHAEMFISLHG